MQQQVDLQVDNAQQDQLDHLEKMDLMVKMVLMVNQVKNIFKNIVILKKTYR